MSLAIFFATYDNLAEGLSVGPLPGDVQGQQLGWYVTDPTQLGLVMVPTVESEEDLTVPSPDYYNRTTPAIWVVQFLNALQESQGDAITTPTFSSADLSPFVDDTVVSITVSPGSVSLAIGQTQQFVAHALNANGVEVPNAPIIWVSSNISAAVVDNEGLATAVGVGPAVIFANLATDESVSSFASLLVH